MILQWFMSRMVRQAVSMRRHVRKLLNHQRDILSPQAVTELEKADAQMRETLRSRPDKETLTKQMASLEQSANKWLKPYPNAAWRENVEVLLVALAVAMGVRTFFLQPFKIPTGSMQPTLWGVTHVNHINDPDFKIPPFLTRVKHWFQGKSYVHVVAKTDGRIEGWSRPWPPAIFSIFQRIRIGGQWHVIWFPPDYGAPPQGTLESRAELHRDRVYRKGEDVIKLEVNAGDHLFVNRTTYNFRKPRRGEIIVFETHGITKLDESQQNTFYIKRLVGLSGETLTIDPDYTIVGIPRAGKVLVGHLVVDGEHLSASTPRFENLYTYYGARPGVTELQYVENEYFGHAMVELLGPGQPPFTVGTNSLFVLGDNTMNSSDSRVWGDFSKDKVIGKSSFVYWPISERFGWSAHR